MAFNIVPTSSWTIEKEGGSKAPISALGDKRQITATVAGANSLHWQN